MKKTKEQKGITIIALIITIIILLILAVVTINSIKNGQTIDYAKQAQKDYNSEKQKEEIQIQNYLDIINENDPNKKIKEEIKHNGIIPEGGMYITGVLMDTDNLVFNYTTKLEAGQKFPDNVSAYDMYVYGDYIYGYKMVHDTTYPFSINIEGIGRIDHLIDFSGDWTVIKVLENNKKQYGNIISVINNKPITNMYNTFSGCTSLTEAPLIPNSVVDMENAFYGCTALTTVPSIPSCVTNMKSTFYNCASLIEVPSIPNSVKNMESTFYNCTSLTEAPSISNSVESLTQTFYNCTSLTEVPSIPNSVRYMDTTFYSCTSLTDLSELIIPSSVINMQATFSGCTSLITAPVIPSNVKSIRATFSNCTSLRGSITINSIPESPEEYYACLRNTKITSVEGDTTLKSEILATVSQ